MHTVKQEIFAALNFVVFVFRTICRRKFLLVLTRGKVGLVEGNKFAG